jgi:hypothetical protein
MRTYLPSFIAALAQYFLAQSADERKAALHSSLALALQYVSEHEKSLEPSPTETPSA